MIAEERDRSPGTSGPTEDAVMSLAYDRGGAGRALTGSAGGHTSGFGGIDTGRLMSEG